MGRGVVLNAMADISNYIRTKPEQSQHIPGGCIKFAGHCEAMVSSKLLDRLSFNFNIKEQVNGTHFSGNRMRIDAIIEPKNRTGWANEDVVFGVEIKRGSGDTGEYCKHFCQSVDYANSHFDEYGHVFILCYPNYFPGQSQGRVFFDRIAGRLGIGFIDHRAWSDGTDELSIIINGHTIWSESNGVCEGSRWKLKRKFGSR
jgi:hypothetical protein